MSILATKRRHSDLDPSTSSCTFKRFRPLPALPTLPSLLSHPPHSHLASARHSLLQNLHLPSSQIHFLLQNHFHGNISSFLKLLDSNLYSNNILAIVQDFSQRGVPLVRLNLSGHSFSCQVKSQVLQNFETRFASDIACPNTLVRFIVQQVWTDVRQISIAVFNGGGIRDILLADWCRMYQLYRSDRDIGLVLVHAPGCGRSLLVPYEK